MKSFGIWYKLTDEAEKKFCEENDGKSNEYFEEKLNIEMHVNLWSKMPCKKSRKMQETFLDIGLKITNYKHLNNLIFICPFILESQEIIDLAPKLKYKKNANLIFNNECEIETKGNYTVINDSDKNEKLLVYPLNQSLEKILTISKICDKNCKIDISFKEFKDYINDKSVERKLSTLKDLDTVYIRFRIKSERLKEMLVFNVDPINKYFESGFISTQIIDFKINNKRNIDENVLAKAIINKEHLAKFSKIHFLLMEPANNDVIDISNEMSNCRKLESHAWDDYLDTGVDTNNILVYHWKEGRKKNGTENSEDSDINEFGKLVKINYSKTDKGIIFNYIVVVTILGIISGLIANSIFGLINYNEEGKRIVFDIATLIISILITFGGVLRFRTKK